MKGFAFLLSLAMLVALVLARDPIPDMWMEHPELWFRLQALPPDSVVAAPLKLNQWVLLAAGQPTLVAACVPFTESDLPEVRRRATIYLDGDGNVSAWACAEADAMIVGKDVIVCRGRDPG